MFKKSIFLVAILSLVFLSACSLKKEKELTLEEAKVKAEQFINDHFMDPSYPVEIQNIEKDDQTGLYKFYIDLGDGELIESYISRDGEVFFPQAYDMAEVEDVLNGGDEQSLEEQDAIQNIETNNAGENLDIPDSSIGNEKIVVYFFWGDGCPYCEKQKEAMVAWSQKYPSIEIKDYETWKNQDNKEILEKMATSYGASVQGVPMTFIGDKYWVGFSESLGAEMESKLKECSNKSCENPGNRI
jgi:thiol-disulfide isomerase/thioredoxin